MMFCTKCHEKIHPVRIKMGYTECVKCSTEVRWSGVQIVHHKTGNTTQIIKDPEVAAEFIGMSTRKGFGASNGMKGTWRNMETHEPKKEVRVIPSHVKPVVVAKRKIVTNYQDEELGPVILGILDDQGKEEAVKFLEAQFQSLKISPDCRKRLLLLINNS